MNKMLLLHVFFQKWSVNGDTSLNSLFKQLLCWQVRRISDGMHFIVLCFNPALSMSYVSDSFSHLLV